MQNAVLCHCRLIARPFPLQRSQSLVNQTTSIPVLPSTNSPKPLRWNRPKDGLLTLGTLQRNVVVSQSSSDDVQETSKTKGSVQERVKLLFLFLASASALYLISTSQLAASLRGSVMSSWLGKSGFVASLSLIFLSEIGDKTFFICAILAMRLGRWISFLGTTFALATMTLLSVGIGVAFNAVPDAMRTSIPVGKYLSVALLFFFGVRSLLNGMQASEEEGGELVDAEETVELATQSGRVRNEDEEKSEMDFRKKLRSVFVVSALIFVAEWGDRSMLTTIALGASQSPLGVALGGIVGHILAAIIAVLGGSLISNFISEKSVNFVSGLLFIIFAITTCLNWT